MENTSYYKKKLEVTFDNINFLLQALHKNSNPNKGILEVKLLSYPPSFGIVNIKSKENSIIITELYPHHVGYDTPPIFKVDNIKDKRWYSYFSNQFEAMWSRAKDYEVKIS